MAKLQVIKVTIRNIMLIEFLEFYPRRLTVIKGPNGSGKTSVLEAVRAAFQGGNDPSLLRNGATEGEVILLLDDGTEITKKVTASKSSLTVKHPSFGKASRRKDFVDNLINRITLNPVEFLVSGASRQKEMLLQAIPISVTAEQIEEVTHIAVVPAEAEGHALEVITRIHDSIYHERTGANRALKEKQSTAKQLQEALPEEPPEGDWLTQHENLAVQMVSYEQKTTHHVRQLEREQNEELKALNEALLGMVKRAEADAAAKIEVIKAELKRQEISLNDEYQIAIDKIISIYQSSIDDWQTGRQPERDQLVASKQHARTMADMSVKAESSRELLARMITDTKQLQDESTLYTKALEGLDQLQSELTRDLPIQGLSIRDGELYLDDIVFARCNEAKKVEIAIEIAKLSAGNLGLVVEDGLEQLDSHSFQALINHIMTGDTCQYILSRVTEDKEMIIETF